MPDANGASQLGVVVGQLSRAVALANDLGFQTLARYSFARCLTKWFQGI